MESRIAARSTPLSHNLTYLLLLLFVLVLSSYATIIPDDAEVLAVFPAGTLMSRTHHAGRPSFLASSLMALQEEVEEEEEEAEAEAEAEEEAEAEAEAKEREETLLSCIQRNIGDVVFKAKIMWEKMNDFKDSYTLQEYNMTFGVLNNIIPLSFDVMAVEVCSVDQTCSTVLPSLPPLTTPPPATDNEAAESLAMMSSHVVHFSLAFQQLLIDQSMYEGKFASEMNDAFIDHEQLLMLLDTVLETCSVEDNYSGLAQLHGKMHITTTDPQTDYRGFGTIRQSLHCLELIDNMFGGGFQGVDLVSVEERKDEEEEEEEYVAGQREGRMRRWRRKKKEEGRHSSSRDGKRRKRRKDYLG